METARFLVALTRTQDAQCRVERTVRRSDPNRAVFYATNWLLKTQRLEHYFGVTYNVYEIYQQDATGQWVQVEIGDVNNAENRRTSTRPETAKSQTPSMDQKGGSKQRRTTAKSGRDIDDPLAVTDKIRGPSKQFRRVKTLSPFQQRVKAELELAKQRLAERKANGEG